MRFKVDLKIFLFFILFYFTKQIETYVMILIFAMIHELGHLLVGIILGMRPNKIELTPFGFSISFKIVPKDYNVKILEGNRMQIKEIIIALAGPLTNFIILYIVTKLKINLFSKLMIVYSNILLIIFNLLPMYPLDGGRILKAVLHILFGRRKAEKYINNISFVVLLILTAIASVGIFYAKNISIFIIIIFLWCLYIQEDLVYRRRNKIYELIRKTLEIEKNK